VKFVDIRFTISAVGITSPADQSIQMKIVNSGIGFDASSLAAGRRLSTNRHAADPDASRFWVDRFSKSYAVHVWTPSNETKEGL